MVGDCDREYNYDSRKNTLHWSLPVIYHSNKSDIDLLLFSGQVSGRQW